MMQYLVVESDPMDPLEAQRRLQQLADYLALDSYNVVQSVPRRHVRATSVHYPIREVEIIRENQTPVYDVRRYRTVSRNENHIPAMEEKMLINRTPLFRLACPSTVSSYVPYYTRRYPSRISSRTVDFTRPSSTYYVDDNSYNYWPLRRHYGRYEYHTPPSYYTTTRRYPSTRSEGLSTKDVTTTRSYYPSSSYGTSPYNGRLGDVSLDNGDTFLSSKLTSSTSALDELSPLRRRIKYLLSHHKRRV